MFLERVQEDSFPPAFCADIDYPSLRRAAEHFLLLGLGEPGGSLPDLPGFSDIRLDRWAVHLGAVLRDLGADEDMLDQAAINVACTREQWRPVPAARAIVKRRA